MLLRPFVEDFPLSVLGSMLCQGGFNGIAHIGLVKGIVDLGTLTLDIRQVCVNILKHIFHLIIFQASAKASREPFSTSGGPDIRRSGD